MKHFLYHLQEQIRKRPDAPVLTDYQTDTAYTFRTMAEEMARINALLDAMGVMPGDKVALCGRNSSHWAIACLALMASKRVAVSILPDFTSEGIRALVQHSEAKVLMVSEQIWKRLQDISMPDVQIIGLWDLQPIHATTTVTTKTPQSIDELLQWDTELTDRLALINYTSGTTSSPKGVMLTDTNLSANVEQVFWLVDVKPGEKLVSILPLAHMYGLCVEMLGCVALGVHVHFIQRTPTPTILAEALNQVKPCAMVCVPLVLEKVFRKSVLPIVKKPAMRLLMALPGVRTILARKIRNTILQAMGGNIRYFVVGGAALNQEVEEWMFRLGLPYIVGYGMTECAPLITASRVGTFAKNSCGRPLQGMELRIDSSDPIHTPGEIMTRGTNRMLGYYKNDEATQNTITEDGWLRTGDLGIVDEQGNLFIKGRSKSMILGPSGQNIYPEEIEDRLNGLPGVAESLVIERQGKLVALIYCDPAYTRKLRSEEKHQALLRQRITRLNQALPAYSQIMHTEFVEEEFEKTPKRSIKRFLYQ